MALLIIKLRISKNDYKYDYLTSMTCKAKNAYIV